MSKPVPNIIEFDVSIDWEHEGRIYVLWPCDGAALHRFVKEKFDLDSGERDTWDGKCYFSQELDERLGRAAVVMALKGWELNLKEPQLREINSH